MCGNLSRDLKEQGGKSNAKLRNLFHNPAASLFEENENNHHPA